MRLPERLVSRRVLLRSGAGVGAAMGLASLFAPVASAAVPAAPATGATAGEVSVNGWERQGGADSGMIWTRPVAGSDVAVAVHIGDVEVVLMHVIRRYHYEIGTLRSNEVVGFQPASPALAGYRTNHASGTAVDIRPGWYPTGSRTVSGYDLEVIRDVLAECAGVVAWGGDIATPDESHFQIDVAPTNPLLRQVANKIRGWNDTPGLGARVMLVGA